eukprot:2894527-Rhodomonas_salina.1
MNEATVNCGSRLPPDCALLCLFARHARSPMTLLLRRVSVLDAVWAAADGSVRYRMAAAGHRRGAEGLVRGRIGIQGGCALQDSRVWAGLGVETVQAGAVARVRQGSAGSGLARLGVTSVRREGGCRGVCVLERSAIRAKGIRGWERKRAGLGGRAGLRE